MRLDYHSLENELFDMLGESKVMVLATSSNDRVTARSMSCVMYDKKIYFQTNEGFLKYEQMTQNPNVAMCVNNMQMEGIAHIKKHPDDEAEFTEYYKKHHKGSYDAYSHMSKAVVIEVEPTFVTLWKYEDGHPLRDFLDFRKKTARREIYDTSV